ncbi:MAG: hypothetical protein IJM25_09300 [Eubacterium sp.]|nr:hypothetical protein [Eubacterium sp.]
MIRIREVKTKKEQRAFVHFPLKLYKGNEYYVPMFYNSEFDIFKPDYAFNKVCDSACFLALKDGEVVGRIQGIIQREANEKWGQKRVRFTRFDSIDDVNVAAALFTRVERWAREKGMEEFVGPLGYSDLEREGLLIEGFDQPQTFEEQYNYPYYQKLIEAYGFEKEADWLEHQLYAPEERADQLVTISQRLLDRFGLELVQAKSNKEIIEKHIQKVFKVVETAYSRLYGTMPLNQEIIDNYVKDFNLIVRPQDLVMIYDKNQEMVAFALMFPSTSEAVRLSNGHITPAFIKRFLHDKKHPKVMDLGLIGVLPEYEAKGVVMIMIGLLVNLLIETDLDHLETNLVLEDNYNMLNIFKHFEKRQNKRRRVFKKKIGTEQ